MVAASKLRRAQERIMSARPYARADAARARQRRRARRSVDSPAARPSRAARRQRRRCVIVVTGDKGLCGSFNTNVIKAGGAFVVEQPPAVHARAGRPQGPRFLRPPRLRGAVRADRHLPEAASTTTRRRSRRPAIDAFISGQVDRVMLVYNEFKSVMTQRVVVDQLLPIARADVEATATATPIVAGADPRRRSTTCTNRRRRRSSTSCCRATSRFRSTARCSNRTPRSLRRR